MRSIATLSVFVCFGPLAFAGCSAVDDTAQAAVISVAARVTKAMKPCDAAWQAFRGNRSAKLAGIGYDRCIAATNDISAIDTPPGLDDRQSSVLRGAVHTCALSAGARGVWMNGLGGAAPAIPDGEDNSAALNIKCINDLNAAADSVWLEGGDSRIKTPAYILDKS